MMMSCLFCNIATGNIPATVVYEDADIMAFEDIHPQAPTHLLIIPKRHISTIDDVETGDELLLGRMIITAKRLAQQHQLTKGYRLIFNVNPGGGQVVLRDG